MYCSKCGAAMSDSGTYCTKCGAFARKSCAPATDLDDRAASPQDKQAPKKKINPYAVYGYGALLLLIAVIIGVASYVLVVASSNGTMSGTWVISSSVGDRSSADAGEITATFENGRFRVDVGDLGYFGKHLLGSSSVKNDDLVASLIELEGTYTETVSDDSLVCELHISTITDNPTALMSAGVAPSAISFLEDSDVTIVLPAKGWTASDPVGTWSIARSESSNMQKLSFDLGERDGYEEGDPLTVVRAGSVTPGESNGGSGLLTFEDAYWYSRESSESDIDLTIKAINADGLPVKISVSHDR